MTESIYATDLPMLSLIFNLLRDNLLAEDAKKIRNSIQLMREQLDTIEDLTVLLEDS